MRACVAGSPRTAGWRGVKAVTPQAYDRWGASSSVYRAALMAASVFFAVWPQVAHQSVSRATRIAFGLSWLPQRGQWHQCLVRTMAANGESEGKGSAARVVVVGMIRSLQGVRAAIPPRGRRFGLG